MTGELLLFARAVWYGACLLLLYDVLRILRRTIHHGPVWTAVEDILYWVFCAVWLFSRFYQENDGILRAYFFAGIFLGALACRASISRFFCRIWRLAAARLRENIGNSVERRKKNDKKVENSVVSV